VYFYEYVTIDDYIYIKLMNMYAAESLGLAGELLIGFKLLSPIYNNWSSFIGVLGLLKIIWSPLYKFLILDN